MSHKKFYSLGFLPVLGLMMMSPTSMRTMNSGRSIAMVEKSFKGFDQQRQRIHELARAGELPLVPVEPAVQEKPAQFPKFSVISERFQKENPHVANNDLNRDIYLNNLETIVSMIDQEKETIAKELTELPKLKEAQDRIRGQVEAISQYEKDLADLELRTLIKADDEKKPRDQILSSKTKLEDLLSRIETAKVALEAAPAKPALIVLDPVEPAKVEAPKVVAEEKKDTEEDPKPRSTRRKREKEEKSELEQILCDLRDQNKAMSENMQKLVSDQQTIMQQMLSMMQNFVSAQNFREERERSNSLYQYHPQFPQGNWVYMPHGAQPSTSLFGQQTIPNFYTPQLFGQAPTYNTGAPVGNESAVSSGSWSLRPDQSLQLMDPRLVPMQTIVPGQFGSAPSDLGSFGFDMSQGSPLAQPFLTQPQQPQQPQPFQPQLIPFTLPSTSPQFPGRMTLV